MADPEGRRPPSNLRHRPPDLGTGFVLRPRLIGAIRDRFDRRLTVLVAGPGFGKTTLLAQAVDQNRLERRGVDAWLRATDADQEPAHLCAGLVRSLTGAAGAGLDVAAVVDAVWSAAPDDVALVIDDVHLLGDDGPSWAVLADVLDRLPDNGHLVLAGRRPVPLPVGRLVAEDAAVVVDEAALAFTADERDAFAAARGVDPAVADELPPWPALAALTSTVGHRASAGLLWDEVFASLPPERTRLLALAAPFDEVDDALVAALDPDDPPSAAALVAGIPLVQRDGRGAHRFHALLTEALADRVRPEDRRRALAAAAARLIERGAERRAAEAAALAGDRELLHLAICRVAGGPIASVSVPDVVALYERLPPDQRAAPIGAYLDAARHWAAGAREATARFERAVEVARRAGDLEVEALARWRVVQQRYLDDPATLQVDDRMRELATTGVPLARSTPAFVASVEAQRRGDVAAAIAALDELDDADPDQRRATLAVRLLDLGRPEAAPATIESLFEPGAAEPISAMSVWLRGDAGPEDAWSIGSRFPGVTDRRGVLHDHTSLHAVVAVVAAAAGALDDAVRAVEQARSTEGLVGRQVELLARVAAGVVALSTAGEDVAVAELRAALDLVPIDGWVARGHLVGLAALRGLLPEEAAGLDGVELGPALATTVAAGRALAELRRTGDHGPAAALPWLTPNVVRCLVPPPLLAELALAADEAGAPGAADVLAATPRSRRWLERLAAGPGPQRRTATRRLARAPARPPYDLDIRCFGELTVTRSDGRPVDPARLSRERVRQILAHLVVERSIVRAELAARLWPDLPPAKALDNLRVNLRHLQAALQPDRGGDPPWFVTTGGDTIALTLDGVTIDAVRFDQHVRRATEAESQGLPTLALAEHRAAAELATGAFLAGVEDVGIDAERLRYASLAHASRCRVGELVLARGEPEAAMRDAAQALRSDPTSERAHRLFIRCHLAVGSTDAARAVGRRLVEQLATAGLEPETETTALLGRIGVPAPERRGFS